MWSKALEIYLRNGKSSMVCGSYEPRISQVYHFLPNTILGHKNYHFPYPL